MLNIRVIRPLPYAGELLQNIRKSVTYDLLNTRHTSLFLILIISHVLYNGVWTPGWVVCWYFKDANNKLVEVPRFLFDTFHRALFFCLWFMLSLWPSTEDSWIQCTLTSMLFRWPVIENVLKSDGVFDVHFMFNVNLTFIDKKGSSS